MDAGRTAEARRGIPVARVAAGGRKPKGWEEIGPDSSGGITVFHDILHLPPRSSAGYISGVRHRH
jgi:hypothetical protein